MPNSRLCLCLWVLLFSLLHTWGKMLLWFPGWSDPPAATEPGGPWEIFIFQLIFSHPSYSSPSKVKQAHAYSQPRCWLLRLSCDEQLKWTPRLCLCLFRRLYFKQNSNTKKPWGWDCGVGLSLKQGHWRFLKTLQVSGCRQSIPQQSSLHRTDSYWLSKTQIMFSSGARRAQVPKLFWLSG